MRSATVPAPGTDRGPTNRGLAAEVPQQVARRQQQMNGRSRRLPALVRPQRCLATSGGERGRPGVSRFRDRPLPNASIAPAAIGLARPGSRWLWGWRKCSWTERPAGFRHHRLSRPHRNRRNRRPRNPHRRNRRLRHRSRRPRRGSPAEGCRMGHRKGEAQPPLRPLDRAPATPSWKVRLSAQPASRLFAVREGSNEAFRPQTERKAGFPWVCVPAR